MTFPIVAALALAADPTPNVAGTPLQSNLEYSVPIIGSWTYAPTTGGSEATFNDSAGRPQLTLRCTRATRRITLSKAASTASPTLWVWTSSAKKVLPATFDSATGRVSADVGAYDSLLDAIASSRGRIGFSSSGLEALVVPPWADVPRVIEDCRV
jgi:hypothetical protein